MLLIDLKLTTQKYSKEKRIEEKYNLKDQNLKLNKAEEFDDTQRLNKKEIKLKCWKRNNLTKNGKSVKTLPCLKIRDPLKAF